MVSCYLNLKIKSGFRSKCPRQQPGQEEEIDCSEQKKCIDKLQINCKPTVTEKKEKNES
jgi:hypothetical protein